MRAEKALRVMRALLIGVAAAAAVLSVIAAYDVKATYAIGAVVWALIALAALRA